MQDTRLPDSNEIGDTNRKHKILMTLVPKVALPLSYSHQPKFIPRYLFISIEVISNSLFKLILFVLSCG